MKDDDFFKGFQLGAVVTAAVFQFIVLIMTICML